MGTFEKHLSAIKSGRIDKTNVIGIKKAFNAFDRMRAGHSVSSTAPKITVEEYEDACGSIARHHPTVTGTLHESGLKVLRNPRYTNRWTADEKRIIAGATRFDLVRFDRLGYALHVPVYRVISRDGESFTFRNIPWQTAHYYKLDDGPRRVRDLA